MAKTGYRYEPRCKVCTAKDKDGNPIRDEIDAYAATGATLKEVQQKLAEYGVFCAIRNIWNHFDKHSPFVKVAKKLGSRKSQKLRMSIEKQQTEAIEALQRIITIGDQMVQNWVEDRDGPKMPVTEKLYIEALKEMGRHGTKTTLDYEFEAMEQALFEPKEKKNAKKLNSPTVSK